eukprot:2547960-Rhodomonas_salina.7
MCCPPPGFRMLRQYYRSTSTGHGGPYDKRYAASVPLDQYRAGSRRPRGGTRYGRARRVLRVAIVPADTCRCHVLLQTSHVPAYPLCQYGHQRTAEKRGTNLPRLGGPIGGEGGAGRLKAGLARLPGTS